MREKTPGVVKTVRTRARNMTVLHIAKLTPGSQLMLPPRLMAHKSGERLRTTFPLRSLVPTLVYEIAHLKRDLACATSDKCSGSPNRFTLASAFHAQAKDRVK